jgi:hypothetical protein
LNGGVTLFGKAVRASLSLRDPKEVSMQRGSDTFLLSATIILAAITTALSSEPVRHNMDDYFAVGSRHAWEETALVMGANMSEDPARASTPMDWNVPDGRHNAG